MSVTGLDTGILKITEVLDAVVGEMKIDFIRWVGATAVGHTCELTDSNDNIIFSSEAESPSFVDVACCVSINDGIIVSALDSGTLYIYQNPIVKNSNSDIRLYEGYDGADYSLSNLAATAINKSLLPDTNNSYDIGSSSLRWKNGYFSGVMTVYDLVVESGSSIKLAGATFENKGHYTSVDTNWIIEHADQPTAFTGVYANDIDVLTHANLVLEAQDSPFNLVKNSPNHPSRPDAGEIINYGDFSIYIDHAHEMSWEHYTEFTKDAYGNITELTGLQSLMRLTDNLLILEDVNLQTGRIQSEYNLHINSDSQGDVRFFDGADIPDATDGEKVYIYRRALEGDSYINFYIDRFQHAKFNSNVDIYFTDGIYNTLIITEADHVVNAPYGLQAGGVDVLTSETDPVFSAWNKTDGIIITENQISDLSHTPVFDGDIPEIYNSSGLFKIQPNVQGDVELFGDTDVGNNENSKIFKMWRRAPEGNDYIRMYISANRNCFIHASNKLTLQAQVPFTINSVTDDIIFKVGDNAGAKKFYFQDSDNNDLVTIDSNGLLGIGKAAGFYPLEILTIDPAIKLENARAIMGMGYNVGALIFNAGESVHEDVALIRVNATENWTDSSYPCRMAFYTTPVGSTRGTSQLTIEETGEVVIEETLKIKTLPTSDPTDAGALWNSGGTVKVSAG